MIKTQHSLRRVLGCTAAAGALFFALGATAQEAPILQPGAPGQATRALSAEEAARVSSNRYSADDVAFMQGMVHHHAQAVRMAGLVGERTNTPAIVDLAGRINASQADEIEFMQGWLRERGETAPEPMAGMDHGAHGAHGGQAMAGHDMPGMATPEQMAALTAARGAAFDQMFLQLVIAHHEGAVKMVADLLARPGSAYDPILYRFANDVTNEQQAEINRMTALARERSNDPRATLRGGLHDAEQAALNLRLLSSQPKPPGFFDPENPAGLPPTAPSGTDGGEPLVGTRSPFLTFSNTDMAFQGDLLAVGNYNGFNLYRIGEQAEPQLISSVVCPGGQGDVSIVGDLLLMSVESTNGRVDCGRQGVPGGASDERFRGLRIFNISDRARPVQVGQVQTCRGSHTHSVVDANEERLIVYNSGTAGVRDERELAGCVTGAPGDPRTALFRVDVIEIPLADPSRSRIIDSPTVFADEETGAIAGLWRGGDHGEGTQTTAQTNHCHDITLFPTKGIAGGACSGNGILFDISDPRHPRRIDAVTDTGFAYWHSATFNNDGTKVVFTDEWGGGGRPRCRVQDPMTWGADAIYDIVDNELVFRGYYKLPAPQTDKENCVAHNGSLIPVPGRDLFVQAWYQGGLSISDFTDSAHAREIAYFDRGPVNDERQAGGGYWSVYWYNGRIYGSEIARGLDVLELTPSDLLTANEIAAAAMADQGGAVNPQQQYPVRWPAHPVVARAYLDQLARDDAMPAEMRARITTVLDPATPLVDGGGKDADVAARLNALADEVRVSGDDQTAKRMSGLKATLSGIAQRVG
jgi:uncharacterized protein (DUF305 family)